MTLKCTCIAPLWGWGLIFQSFNKTNLMTKQLFQSNLMLFLSLLCLFSCTKKALVTQTSKENCTVSSTSFYYDSLLYVTNQKNTFDTTSAQTVLKPYFSNRTVNIAKCFGSYSLLCEYARAKSKSTDAMNDTKLSYLRNELQQQIFAATADVNSMQAEIACEKSRMLELQKELQSWISKRLDRATVYSIALGGLVTIIGSTIALNEGDINYEQGSQIIGAVAVTYLSFRSIAVRKKVLYLHENRNHLKDIYEDNIISRTYSPFLWNFMSKEFKLNGTLTTGKKEIIKKWEKNFPILLLDDTKENKKHNKEVKNNKELMTKFVGKGTEYSVDELETRIYMYETLAAELDLVHYDLKRLQQEMLIKY